MFEIELLAGHGKALVGLRFPAAGLQQQVERSADVAQRNPVLGALGTGQGGLHFAEIEFQRGGEQRVRRAGVAPHALRLAVGLDQRDALFVAAGQAQVVEGDLVDGEEAAGRTIFRGHVADGGAIGQRQVIETGAEELDELADHALLAQHLRDGQHQVGGGHALVELSCQAHADDFGNEHGDRLTQHRRFRLDAADAPAQYAEAVDHGGV